MNERSLLFILLSMKKYLLLFFVFLIPGITHGASSICTAEYAPVCGQPPMPSCTSWMMCVQVMPAMQTYGNMCMANAAGATNISSGECGTLTIDPPALPIADEYGCTISEWYAWDPLLSSCIQNGGRPQALVTWAYENKLSKYNTQETFWYDRPVSRQEAAAIFARTGDGIFALRYASYPDICNIPYKDENLFDTTLKNTIYSACAFEMMRWSNGIFSPHRELSRAEALAIIIRAIDGGKKDEAGYPWYILYQQRASSLGIISSVAMKWMEKPITRWELIEWIYSAYQYRKSLSLPSNLMGDWKLQSYRVDDMMFASDKSILTFTQDTYSIKLCNTIRGSYSVKNGIITSWPAVSTKMACTDSHLSIIEWAWDMNGATYTIQSQNIFWWTSIMLILTTKTGGVFTFIR